MSERDFLWWRTSEWESAGVWATGLFTIGLLIYAALQLRHSQQVRDDQSRPHIVVDFHFRSVLVALSVRNIGQTAARDVRVRLAEPLTSAAATDPALPWQTHGLFGTEGVSLFAPGREMRFLIDTFDKRYEAKLPMSISGTVEYKRARGDEVMCESFTIDMTPYALALVAPKDIADIGDEAEKIRKLLEKLAKRPSP
jgi:hypothetical protein